MRHAFALEIVSYLGVWHKEEELNPDMSQYYYIKKVNEMSSEIELKFIVSRSDFHSLLGLSFTEFISTKVQTNSYYDDDKFSLYNKKMTARIRSSGNKESLFTLKLSPKFDEAIHTCEELEFNINNVIKDQFNLSNGFYVKNIVNDKIKKHLETVGINFLHFIGSSLNIRHIVKIKGHLFEFDEYFPSLSVSPSYEIEIERKTIEEIKEPAEFIQTLSPSAVTSCVSKFSKFMSYIKK